MADDSRETLSVSVNEAVKTQDTFGMVNRQMQALKGVAGTLHITRKEDKAKMVDAAYALSEQTKLPVIIVVRALND